MAAGDTLRLTLDEISIPDGRRPADADTVKRLAVSIKEIGLQHPITVRSVAGQFVLVAGRHRVEAMRHLREEYIRATIVSIDDVDARLWEIAENLHRAELTKLERAEQIAEWVRLTDEKAAAAGATCAGSLRDGRKAGPQHQPSGINAATRELGIDRTEAQRAVKIADMAPDARQEASRLGLENNQSALLRAAREQTPSAQIIALRAHVEPKSDDDVIRQQADAIIGAWNRACPQARQIAMETLDRPVMDGRYA